MKKILLLTIVCFLWFAAGNVSLCFSESDNQDNIDLIETRVYLDGYEDGKISGEKVIADLLITNLNGCVQVFWEHIYITPFPEEKDVCLKIQRFSSDEGTIVL